MTNCPNCGAVITGPQCEYCGTRFTESYRSDEVEKFRKLNNELYLLECELIRDKLRVLGHNNMLMHLYEDAIKSMRSYSGRGY
jgi:methionyl-tRNA synthetase